MATSSNRLSQIETASDGLVTTTVYSYNRAIALMKAGVIMNWKEVFEQTIQGDDNYILQYYEAIQQVQIDELIAMTGTEIPNDLFELLQQTNGIYNNRYNEFIVYSSEKTIEVSNEYLMNAHAIGNNYYQKFLFFADNGCGELFGYRLGKDSKNIRNIGIYYPITGEYKVICPDLHTWVKSWFSGELET